MEKLPPLEFVTGIAHAGALGPHVCVISFSGFEQLSPTETSLPVTRRLVITRADLAQGVEFLKGWLDGTAKPVETGPVQ